MLGPERTIESKEMERDREVDNSRTYIPRRALKEDADLAAITSAIKNLEQNNVDTYGLFGLRQIRYAAYARKYPDGYPEEKSEPASEPSQGSSEATPAYGTDEAGYDEPITDQIERDLPVPVSAIGSSAMSLQVAGPVAAV